MLVIGFLGLGSSAQDMENVAALRGGLAEAGYVEGQNVTITFRWANGQFRSLPGLAADLVRSQAGVIIASGAIDSPIAAKTASSTIPIVFLNGGDPVKYGLVASLSRPGGNITGMTFLSQELGGKRLAARTHSPRDDSRLSFRRFKKPGLRGAEDRDTGWGARAQATGRCGGCGEHSRL